MYVVDTHCHVSLSWYNPVESLLFEMDQNQVQRALLIQMGGQYDNAYQTECVARYPDRLSSVVMVDAGRPDAPDTLASLAEQGAVGVRLSADTRSPGDDPLAVWRRADELGLVVSCSGSVDSFASDSFASLLEALPSLPVVIEHLGGVSDRNNPEAPYTKAEEVFALARFANTAIKIHGLGEFAVRHMPVTEFPFAIPIPPFLQMAYEAFGPARMMWGSDYPPVSFREGYRNALELTRAQFGNLSVDEAEQIFGGTALVHFPSLRK
jgi:L-fuconolactonase